MYINIAVSALVMASLLQIASTAIYYVVPDNSSEVASDTYTLQYIIDNHHTYFKSDTQLSFSPGQYYLQDNFVIKNVSKFTIHGNRSKLICNRSSSGITISNITSLMINYIEIEQCGKAYDVQVDLHKHKMDNMPFQWRGALYINHSKRVVIHNVSVSISAGVSGMIAINNKADFTIVNFSVTVMCEQLNLTTSGIIFYNDDYSTANTNYVATDISYKTEGLCKYSFILVLLMTQEKYKTVFEVKNTTFSNLHSSGVMYYHSESCGKHNTNIVTFKNCEMKSNHGNSDLNMFYILIDSKDYTFIHVKSKDRKQCNKQNTINFRYCNFTSNSNMNSLIYINLKNCLTFQTIIDIRHSKILNNHNVTFIKSSSQVKVFWQSSLTINVMYADISFNTHSGLASLMSLKNAVIKFMKSVTIKENQYNTAIIQLQFSILKFLNYTEISNNSARHILQGYEGSYYLLQEGTTVNITDNIVYTVVHNALSFDDNLKEICWFQFVSEQGNLDEDIKNNKSIQISKSFKVLLKNNKYIIPPQQLIFLKSRNCSWLTDTAFQATSSRTVYKIIIDATGGKAESNKEMKTVPSKLCNCSNTKTYDCTERELGAIFPGQTLKAQLMIDALIPSKNADITITVKNDKVKKNSCIITDALEMVQTGPSHTCTQYNYTIWFNGDSTKCELYLSVEDMLEIFFVTIKPCPVGFSADNLKKTCDCDAILNMDGLSITSCNLDDGTILRPANSWLSASTVNDSHTYHVTLSCPFDYCLPHSSYLNLSDPNTQCQFSRSGELCGKCKEGLSTVFGSSQCKKCSNMFLFIIVPIAIAGFLLVAMLFTFNFTVANGKINTIIFYANIVNINYLVFFPRYNSPLYVLLSLLNLDLGIEICFYDGMDDYVKSWLQLLFPIYLLIIAGLIIISSRYSVRIQRITARKVLPVLATLFLLSYTKIIRTIGSVLFCYSQITNLPSESTILVWSVSTNIPLFGVKFIVLFMACLILLLIVLPFNVILLFSRKLTYFRFINRLKPFLDAYHGPYKDKVSYWVGLQLLIRIIVLGLSVFDKDVNFLSASILFGVIFCIHGVVNPFKSRFHNIQEALILLNLLAIHVKAFYNSKDAKNFTAVNYLILIAAIYFVIIFIYQCLLMIIKKRNNNIPKMILNFKRLFTWKELNLLKRESSKNKESNIMMELTTTIPDVAYNYKDFQEPLLALSD